LAANKSKLTNKSANNQRPLVFRQSSVDLFLYLAVFTRVRLSVLPSHCGIVTKFCARWWGGSYRTKKALRSGTSLKRRYVCRYWLL